jgi:hypothetical protein
MSMFKFHIHKYFMVEESPKWRLEKCERCGKERYFKKFSGGYQPKPLHKGGVSNVPKPNTTTET